MPLRCQGEPIPTFVWQNTKHPETPLVSETISGFRSETVLAPYQMVATSEGGRAYKLLKRLEMTLVWIGVSSLEYKVVWWFQVFFQLWPANPFSFFFVGVDVSPGLECWCEGRWGLPRGFIEPRREETRAAAEAEKAEHLSFAGGWIENFLKMNTASKPQGVLAVFWKEEKCK